MLRTTAACNGVNPEQSDTSGDNSPVNSRLCTRSLLPVRQASISSLDFCSRGPGADLNEALDP